MEIGRDFFQPHHFNMPSVPGWIVASSIRLPKHREAQHGRVLQREPDVTLFRERHRRPGEWKRWIAHQRDQFLITAPSRVAREVNQLVGDGGDSFQGPEFRAWLQQGIAAPFGRLEMVAYFAEHEFAGAEPARAGFAGKTKQGVMANGHRPRHSAKGMLAIDCPVAVAQENLLLNRPGAYVGLERKVQAVQAVFVPLPFQLPNPVGGLSVRWMPFRSPRARVSAEWTTEEI